MTEDGVTTAAEAVATPPPPACALWRQRRPSSPAVVSRPSALLPLLLVVTLTLAGGASSCYIKSCYKVLGGLQFAGKRSDFPRVKDCPSCGPELAGVCRGPRLCCGPFGCLLGVDAARHCVAEQGLPLPCVAPEGPSCLSLDGGTCATRHLCCNEGGCVEDGACAVAMAKSMLAKPDRRR